MNSAFSGEPEAEPYYDEEPEQDVEPEQDFDAAPVYDEPAYEEPAPTYEEPAEQEFNAAPAFGVAAAAGSMFEDTAEPEPAYEEPAEPAYEEPAEPAYEEPAESEPAYKDIPEYKSAAPERELIFDELPASPQELFGDDYSDIKSIGLGDGTGYKAFSKKHQKQVVIKKIHSQIENLANITDVADRMKRIKHVALPQV